MKGVQRRKIMPLVRISLMQGKPAHYGKQVGEVVFQAMRSAIAIPAHDHFQVITEHDRTSLITLNEGRTLEAKKALYQEIAGRLHTTLGIRTEDVLINLVEVKKENWSFGNGIAQYAQ
jgi:phenylpyruvate tautomerase PptA (4-oxalocrotonate tautomerase family)